MFHARRQVQLAAAGAALLLVILYASAAFQPQYSRRRTATGRAAGGSFGKVTAEAGLFQILEARLQALEKTPILSYQEALKKNEQTCKNREIQSNPDQITGESEFWEQLTSETLQEKRQDVIDAIRNEFGLPGLQHSNPPNLLKSGMFGNGRGLVFTGGNKVSDVLRYQSSRLIHVVCFRCRLRRTPCKE